VPRQSRLTTTASGVAYQPAALGRTAGVDRPPRWKRLRHQEVI